jgi:UrcA family protein
MKRTTVLLMTALVLPLAGYAAAPHQLDDVSVKVSYADLNIDNEAGAKVLYWRLQSAAEQVCESGSHLKLGSLAASARAKECYLETLDKAVAEIDHDNLTRIHES